MKTIIEKMIKENPTFVLLLGLCPTLAVTTTFENSFVMGISVLIILLLSNFTVSLIRKLVPSNVQIPVFIMIIATYVTILDLLIGSYIPELHKTLGIYLPLITVNCIVLGRAIAVASKQKVGVAILDAIGIGLGFLLSLVIIGTFREVLGSGTITFMDSISNITGFRMKYTIIPTGNIMPFTILTKPAGAFLSLGLIIAIANKFRKGSEVK